MEYPGVLFLHFRRRRSCLRSHQEHQPHADQDGGTEGNAERRGNTARTGCRPRGDGGSPGAGRLSARYHHAIRHQFRRRPSAYRAARSPRRTTATATTVAASAYWSVSPTPDDEFLESALSSLDTAHRRV